MANETYTFPSYDDIDQIIREAHRQRARTLRAGFHAVLARITHPLARPHHA